MPASHLPSSTEIAPGMPSWSPLGTAGTIHFCVSLGLTGLLMCPVYLCTFQLRSPPQELPEPAGLSSVLAKLGIGLWAVGLPFSCLDHH